MTDQNRPDEGHALLTDAEALALAAEFDAAVANAPQTWGPTFRDLAREAAHGASVEDELRQVGPEPGDGCPDCDGSGWLPVDDGDAFVECDCVVPS